MVLLHEPEADRLAVEVCEPDQPRLPGMVLPVGDTILGRALADGEPVIVDNLARASDWAAPVPTGRALIAPLAASGTVLGLLIVAQAAETPRFDTEEDISLMSTFAGQAALALERARAQDEREMLVVLEDRERIARDLHDVVIQRLFATGLHLHAARRPAARPEVGQRINAAVDDLDATIRDIRSAIFELRAPVNAALRTDIRATVDAAAASLGFRPELRLDGPIASAVPDEVRPDLLSLLREARATPVRHARGAAVAVPAAPCRSRL